VLLTLPIDPAGMARLAPVVDAWVPPDTRPETLRREVREADGVIVRAQLPDDVFEHAPRLLAVVRHGVGMDMIPVEAATAHGIAVANVPGVNATAVAEYCVAGLLLLARRMHRIDSRLRADGWAAGREETEAAVELRSRTLGIVGVGSVGSALARIAHHGFGMRVLGHQRRLDALPEFVSAQPDLDALFAESDFVVLCCPLTDATRGLASAARIARMRPDAGLINVARGPVVDEPALLEALRAGRIGGAVLDVFQQQPLPRDHGLLGCERAVLTPHAAGITREAMQLMSVGAADDLLRILAGETPRHFVNPQCWPAFLERRRALGYA
jgi:D-3-phosphoglycerate dehydrogenase